MKRPRRRRPRWRWSPPARSAAKRPDIIAAEYPGRLALDGYPTERTLVDFLIPYMQIVQIVLSIALIVVVLLQSRGSGFSATFSADTSIYRTRRGVERLLFQFTIGLAVVFIVASLISVKISAS